MSELPQGWTSASLPELVSVDGIFIDGDWIESKDQDPSGEVRLIQLADVGDGRYVNKSSRFLTENKARQLGCTFLQKGDVLIARMPDPLGRACIFPGDKKRAVTVVDICIVRGNQAHFDHLWLMHTVNTFEFRADIHSLQSGSTRKRISRGNLSTLKLPLPPRAEQTRIVTKLEELLSDLDAGVAELKAAQKKLAQYRQSLLKAAVEGSLTAKWREEQRAQGQSSETGAQLLQRILTERRARWEAKQLAKFAEQGKTPPNDWQKKYPEPVKPDTTGLPELPEGWVWASVDCILAEIDSGKSFKCIERPPAESEVGVVKVSAVSWGEYDEHESKTCEDDEYVKPEKLVQPGDFLFSRANTVELVGACVIAKTVSLRVMLSDKILRLSLVKDELKLWLLFVLRSALGRAQIELLSSGNQESMKNIAQDALRRIAIPLGSSTEVDFAIVLTQNESVSVDRQVSANEACIKLANAQRQNILRAAFAGELVPQDPNDEPASVLLERIRKERIASDSAKKTKAPRKTTKAA